MMRTIVRRSMLAGVCLTAAAVLAACGSDSGGHGSMPGTGSNPGSSTGSSAAASNDADVMFAQMMIPHHRQAVDMAMLADTRAADGEVRRLAAQIKAAQDPEIQTMTGWLTTWGKPVPSASGGMDMGGMSHGTAGMMSDADMAKLQAASGKEFDRQFCTMMIAHHQGAISMAKDELANGRSTAAKKLAQQIITGQQAEIDTMNTIVGRL